VAAESGRARRTNRNRDLGRHRAEHGQPSNTPRSMIDTSLYPVGLLGDTTSANEVRKAMGPTSQLGWCSGGRSEVHSTCRA
jgi:hypothetical protein